MSVDLTKTAQHWDKFAQNLSGQSQGVFWWEAGPEIIHFRNRKISGDPEVDWVKYVLKRYFRDKLPVPHCLSLGCGSGRLERRLAELGSFLQCDAYDIAAGAVEKAKKLAKDNGFEHIHYHVADINKIKLPPDRYNVVWISMAMHHFETLEHINQQIRHALKPDGLLILEEYIGPNRFDFPVRQKEIANLCLQLLPKKYRAKIRPHSVDGQQKKRTSKGVKWIATRFVDKVRDGDLIGVVKRRLSDRLAGTGGKPLEKMMINFPTVRDVIAVDPTEAIRSSEIVDVLKRDFEILEKKDWGGNLLQFLLADIAGNFQHDDETDQQVLKMLLDVEDTLIQAGELESDFAYIVAKPLPIG